MDLMAFLGEEEPAIPELPAGLYTVLVALIVSVLAPLVLNLIQARTRKAEREEARREKEELAVSAAERTDLILIQNQALSDEMTNRQKDTIQRAEEILTEVTQHALGLPEMFGEKEHADELMNVRRKELRALESFVVVQSDIFRIYKERDEIMPQHDIALMNRLRDRIADLKIRMINEEYGPQEDYDERFQ